MNVQENPDIMSDAEEATGLSLFINNLVGTFRSYYRLLFVLLLFWCVITAVAFLSTPPKYGATAVVGPSIPFADTSVAGGGNGLNSLLKSRALLGGNQNPETFTEFTELLTSYRLAEVLATKDHMLQTIFYKRWDAEKKAWKPQDSILSLIKNPLKQAMGWPIKKAPDIDDLAKYLHESLIISTSFDTSYVTVTTRFNDPQKAKQILATILKEADNIIRNDQRRDTNARIRYLNNIIRDVAATEQKEQLITVLSQQEQRMMFIESDYRYASVYIDPPYVLSRPISPRYSYYLLAGLVLSLISWYGVVLLMGKNMRVRALVKWFEPKTNADRSV
jgi:hypothetical protein